MPARSWKEPEGTSVPARILPGAQAHSGGSMAIAPETQEVDAIRQQQNSIPIDAFLFNKGVGDESRAALNPLLGVGEDMPLHGEQDSMSRRDTSNRLADRGMIAAQIVGVAAPARPVEILAPGATETVDDIEGPIACSLCGGAIEGHDSQWLPEARNRYPFDGDLRLAPDFASDDVDVLTGSKEFVGNLPRYVFDAAGVGSEAFDDDRDTQWESSCWIAVEADSVGADSLSPGLRFAIALFSTFPEITEPAHGDLRCGAGRGSRSRMAQPPSAS